MIRSSPGILPETPYYYSCFGLCIQSFFEFRNIPKSSVDHPDVIVRVGEIPEDSDQLPPLSLNAYGTKEFILYRHPMLGDIAIIKGNEIRIDPDVFSKNIQQDVLELGIQGFCMAAVMVQRGYFCFHGGALVSNQLTSVFLGDSGVGKSTFTAWCAMNQIPVFGDDLAAIDLPSEDAPPSVIPSYPRIKLWPETVELLGIRKELLTPIYRESEKYFFSLPEQDAGPRLISKIYFFEASDEFGIEPMPKHQALVSLMKHQYASFAIGNTFGHSVVFQRFTNLLKRVQTYLVHFPRNKEEYENMANAITKHMGEESPVADGSIPH